MDKSKIFLILFLFSFAISIFINQNKINIPYFGALYKKVSVDVIYKNYRDDKVFFNTKQADKSIKIDKNHYLFINKNNEKINTIGFSDFKNIEKINYYAANNIFFNSDFDNSKNIFDKFCISFLAFFYNSNLFLMAYLFLFLFFYSFKKKINHKNIFLLILFLALILRLCQLNGIPFWDDEIYSVITALPDSPAGALFNDPGNPPLYFIILKIFLKFHPPECLYRLSGVIFGIIFNISFYYYLKSTLNKKIALLGFFIAAINIPLIYFSQELRCYILLLAFCAINSALLFKFKNKNKFLYFASSLTVLYTHFYGFFIVLWNFIFGIYLFYKNKKKLLPFIKINLLTGLFYIPLIIHKKSSLTTDFNSWMKPPAIDDYILTIQTIVSFSQIISILFVIVLIYSFIKIKGKKQRLFLKYNFFIIIFTIFAASIFSYLIKPIFCYRYFYIVYLNYIALLCLIIYHFRKNIFIPIILLILFLTNQRLNYQNLFCNHNLYFDFIKHDIDKTQKNYIFVSDTIKGYKKFEIEGAENIYINFNTGINRIDVEKYNITKPCTFYVLNLYLSDDTLKNAQKIELYKSPLGVFVKGKYE